MSGLDNNKRQKDNLTKLQSEKKALESTQSEYDSLLAQVEQEKQAIASGTARRTRYCTT